MNQDKTKYGMAFGLQEIRISLFPSQEKKATKTRKHLQINSSQKKYRGDVFLLSLARGGLEKKREN